MFSVVAALALAVQLAYWHVLRGGFESELAQAIQRSANERTSGAPSDAVAVPATVVVAARNEEADIPRLLEALTRQDHPALEVVVVDDASSDATADLVTGAGGGRTPIRLVQIEHPEAPRKKNALTAGIADAKNDVLLFTDGDCAPSPSWARRISALHTPGSQRVIVGYSPFRRTGGFLNSFARYETFLVGFAAAAAVGLGKPYMAVGRNISYRRTTFESGAGFEHARASMSGDDDLLVQHLAALPGVEIVHAFDTDTFVFAEGPTTWREWINQKLRHASAGRWYTASAKRHLALYHLTAALVWLAPLVAGTFGLAALITRAVWQFVCLRSAARVLGEPDLMLRQPLYEFLYFVYNLVIAPVGVLRRPTKW